MMPHFKLIPVKRKVIKVFIHCSASDNPRHDNVDIIRQWHIQRGWKDVGYHWFVQGNGNIQRGRNVEWIPAAQKGHNTGSIAICVHGLRAFNWQSMASLRDFCKRLNQAYRDKGVRLTFHGHNEVDAGKECPVFDYKNLLQLDDAGRMTLYEPPKPPAKPTLLQRIAALFKR